jgi:4-cresol dehydrogenase (hydroxylating)
MSTESLSGTKPPGWSSERFASVLLELGEVVGPDGLLTGEQLDGHLDPYSFTETDDHRPSAAVLVRSVEEVQAVLRIANAHHLPVWTVSRGRNYGYGGASPRVAGSLVVDLSRMDQVLTVDKEGAYALIEPGVSFTDLHATLQARGAALWASVPDLSWGSVVGNALERGFGYTAYGDNSAQICGLEVVLADGRVVRTGWAL